MSNKICKELSYYCDKIRSARTQLSSTGRSPDGRCRGACAGPEQAAPVGAGHWWVPAGFLTAPRGVRALLRRGLRGGCCHRPPGAGAPLGLVGMRCFCSWQGWEGVPAGTRWGLAGPGGHCHSLWVPVGGESPAWRGRGRAAMLGAGGLHPGPC